MGSSSWSCSRISRHKANPWLRLYRAPTVRMSDGSMQDVAKRGRQIPWGAKVTITAENTVVWNPIALNQ